ncbi:DNA-binding protein [Cladorrhinum sp. PSN259]|nr:DNA-binding protein [Cladorrhinum sp. PSN259]
MPPKLPPEKPNAPNAPNPPKPQQAQDENTLVIDQAHTLLASFSSFLTISIHNILYYRQIYPQETFLSAKAFNLPVHQSRHPKVCSWITDAVTQVSAQLATGNVSVIAVVIHSPFTTPLRPFRLRSPPPDYDNSSSLPCSPPSPSFTTPQPSSQVPGGSVLERYIFDVSRFPRWPSMRNYPKPGDAMRVHGTRVMKMDFRYETARNEYLDSDAISFADVDQQFRGCLKRMAHAMEAMEALPEGCGFTVAIELKKEGEAPIGHPQEWIPSEPNHQPEGSGSLERGHDLGGVKTTAVRTVGVGPFFFESWIEEGEAKEVFMKEHAEEEEESLDPA